MHLVRNATSVLILLSCLVACRGAGSVAADCFCEPGFVCTSQGICRKLCHDSDDCPGTLACVDGWCVEPTSTLGVDDDDGGDGSTGSQDPLTSCTSSADCAPRNACEAAGQCVGGSCIYATTSPDQACDDDNPCTADTCGAAGCEHVPLAEGTACASDGSFCNGPEVCSAGQCVPSGDPCPGRCDEASDSCGSCASDADCPADVTTAWGLCEGFDTTCDETGTQTRTVVDFSCLAGQCAHQTRTESQSCQQSTAGTSCGAETWSGTCDACTPTYGCNLMGTGVEQGFEPTCAGGACQGVSNSRPCRCPAQSCTGEISVYAMADLYGQWARGQEVVRSGSALPDQSSLVFWQINQTSFSAPTWDVSTKTGFAGTPSLTLSPSTGSLASAAQIGSTSAGLWLNTCSPGISAKSSIQPLVLHHDFGAPVHPFRHPNPAPNTPSAPPEGPTSPLLPQLTHPELAFRFEATVPTLETKGGAVAYAAAVMRFRDTSKAPPAGQPAHYYDFWVAVQLVDSRGRPEQEGVIGDACPECSGLPIVLAAESRYGHVAPGASGFSSTAFSGMRSYDFRISQEEFRRMIHDVAAYSPRGYSTKPSDYALVHFNINPEVYDPTPATASCNPATEADYGRIGMTVRNVTISQVSWSKIPHILFRGANASDQWGMQIFFTTSLDGTWDEAKSMHAPLPKTGGTYEVRFNTLANPHWRGTITGLRIDPVNDDLAPFNMDRVVVYGTGGTSTPLWSEECKSATPFPPPWQVGNVEELWSDQTAEGGVGYWGGRSPATSVDPMLIINLPLASRFSAGRQ